MMQVREGGGINKECRVPVWNEGKVGLETACVPVVQGLARWAGESGLSVRAIGGSCLRG